MKKIFSVILGCLLATAAFGQTADEIVARMDEVMSQHSESEGLIMTMDMKLPIIGTISTTAHTLGNKIRMEANTGDGNIISWMNEDTSWTYDVNKNEIEIENRKSSSSEAEDNAKMLTGITEGYSVSIKRQTSDAWYINCKKLKTNKEKDDPKTMELVVAKDTYRPISLSATLSLVTVTIRNLNFGVTESQVTFDPSQYPGARIIDKRQ
jgi:outer membrane lipoprotein-sorting protein